MSDQWQVYVLRSRRNGRLYTGSTNNLPRRLHEHAAGQSRYTRNVGPFELVYAEQLPDRLSARRRELFLKRAESSALTSITDSEAA